MVFYRSVSLLSKLRNRAVQQHSLTNSVRWLQIQTSSDLDIRSHLKELIPEQQERLKKIKSEYGKVQLGLLIWFTILASLLWETSLLDPDEGIRFRGLSIPECQKVLPAVKHGGEPLPEGLLWLLLTGKVPSKEQVDALSSELRSRATIPDHVYKAIDALPITAHPMTQFTTGVMALQEVLLWIKSVVNECGENISKDQLKDYVWKTLNSGKVVPGFGHGVLRKTDPRYMCQREFALKHLPDGPLFQLVSKLYDVVPPILTELGKILHGSLWRFSGHRNLLSAHMGQSPWVATGEAKKCYNGVA
ncbi:hypothetical protein L1987_39379 [Smallanthus sonchifolius]|uniref:Uncharacterized protein n=1 Tax=Smallanthus sonchifolius TaxID=185202 RepID=A0ACB9HNL2_9ASTR|nr:hypothetical protein L1987_39379 [Smallanthus sonchifolius]